MKQVKKDSGHSILEMIFGMGILLVVLLAGNGYLMKMTQHARKVADAGQEDNSFRGFGQRFMFDLQLADVAVHFQRLPIPTRCGALKAGPCLYEMTEDQRLLAFSDASQIGADAIEFFSDRDSRLIAQKSQGSDSDNSQFYHMANLRLSSNAQAKSLYASWVLKDPSDAPFTMMSRVNSGAFFTLADDFAASAPSPGSGRIAIMLGNKDDIDPKILNGKLMVVFNGFNSQQYLVQKIGKAMSCKKGECDGIAKQLNPIFDLPLLKTKPYFAVELNPVPDSTFKGLVAPPHLGRWWSQSESRFMFPTQNASLFAPNNSDFATPADARKILHFYHAHAIKAQLIAIPVEFKTYAFEQVSKSKKRLIASELGPDQRTKTKVVLDSVPSDAYGIFVRKLGTRDFSFFLYR